MNLDKLCRLSGSYINFFLPKSDDLLSNLPHKGYLETVVENIDLIDKIVFTQYTLQDKPNGVKII
jgi:hypothetical protein